MGVGVGMGLLGGFTGPLLRVCCKGHLATGDASVDEGCELALGTFCVCIRSFELEDGVGVERLALGMC
jgi:hypothetical protein